MGAEEFIYIYNKYTFDKRWEIINAFKKTRANYDVDKLTKIVEKCEDFLNYTEDKHILNIKNVCLALLEMNKNNYDSAKNIAGKVWEDLSIRDTWFLDDLVLINNIFFIFDGEVMEEIYKRAIKYLNKYEDFQDNMSNSIRFSLNFNKFSYDMFYGGFPNNSNKLIDDLITSAHDLRYYDIEAVLIVRKGLLINENKLIEKGLKILELLGLNELLFSAQEEIQIYLSEIKKSET